MDENGVVVTVATEGDRLVVRAPYHPGLPDRARSLGGRWDARSRAWSFDRRDEIYVRALLRDIFGEDGSGDVERVDVRITIDRDIPRNELWLLGRCVLRRSGRDAPVRPGPSTSIVAGQFWRRGGSMRYPIIGEPNGPSVTLEVRDVPRPLAEALIARGEWAAEIVAR